MQIQSEVILSILFINIAYLTVLAHLDNLCCHLITYLITLFYVIFSKYKTYIVIL